MPIITVLDWARRRLSLQPTFAPTPTRRAALLAALLGLAALLRLPYPDGRSTYAFWELQRDLGVVESLHRGGVVIAGPTSCLGDFHFGPLYYYLLYPLAALTRFQPWSLAVSSLIFSLLTLLLLFATVRRWWRSDALAFLTLGFGTFAMLDVQWAKYASNPNFVPLLGLACLYSLERLVSDDSSARPRWAWAAAAGLAAGGAMQLHAIPLLAVPLLLAAALWLFRARWRRADLAWLLLGGLTASASYILYELTRGFGNLGSLVSLTLGRGANSPGAPYLFRVADYLTYWQSAIVSSHAFFNVLGAWHGRMLPIAAALLLPILPLVSLDRRRPLSWPPPPELKPRPAAGPLLWLWLAVPTGVLLLPFSAVRGLYYYYFALLMPLTYMLLALGVYALARQRYWRTLLYVTAAWLALQLWQMWVYAEAVMRLAPRAI
jgi:hypothetical protein